MNLELTTKCTKCNSNVNLHNIKDKDLYTSFLCDSCLSEIDKFVKWEWCYSCQTATVICWKCGNNCCNGGTKEDCPDQCQAAYNYQSNKERLNQEPTRDEIVANKERDMFQLSFEGFEVDLNDLNIYPDEWLNLKVNELHKKIWSELGKSLFYMEYFNPEINWGEQRKRVDEFCKQYAKERNKYFSDNEENKLWCMKFLYRFLDEVENQC